MGFELLCSGYVAPVDEMIDEIILDKNNRFKTIPLKIAQQMVKQKNNIPICLEHQQSLIIGIVKSLYIKSVPTVDEKGEKIFSTLLVCDFNINDQDFIYALRYVTQYKYTKQQALAYISTDQFIHSYLHSQNITSEVIDVNAHLALTQKYAGLSIGHDKDITRIKEISICVAGYRDLCLIRSVTFSKNIDLCSDINKKEVDHFKTLFAANFSFSIAHSGEKVKQDLIKLNLPRHCLVYSYHKMYRVNEEQIKKSKSINKDVDNSDNDAQGALHLLQNIVKQHLKQDKKGKRRQKQVPVVESSDEEEAEEQRVSKKPRYQNESNENNSYFNPYKTLPHGYSCIFPTVPPQSKTNTTTSPTQHPQHEMLPQAYSQEIE